MIRLKRFDFFLFLSNLSSKIRHNRVLKEIERSKKEVGRRAFMRRHRNKTMERFEFEKCPYCGEYFFPEGSDVFKHFGDVPKCTPLSEVMQIDAQQTASN